MTLKCVVAFGNFTPGQEVLVPDDSVYDTAYFVQVVEVEETIEETE